MRGVHHVDRSSRETILAAMTQELALRPGLSFAYAFGSFLYSDTFRDIDVAVWLDDESDRRADLELAVALSGVARMPVDVRVANRAPVSFLFHMLRGRPLIVNDERYLADLIERTARIYHDQAPLVRRATHDAFAA